MATSTDVNCVMENFMSNCLYLEKFIIVGITRSTPHRYSSKRKRPYPTIPEDGLFDISSFMICYIRKMKPKRDKYMSSKTLNQNSLYFNC